MVSSQRLAVGRSGWRGLWPYSALFVAAVLVYLSTLAPTIATLFDDSLEFQLVAFQPGIAHPTGYPLYTLLGKLFTWLPPGDVAFRVNLFSAVAAAGAVAALAGLLRHLGLGWPAAVTGAVAFALSRTFWSQAVIAEVYALHALLVVLALLATVRLTANATATRRAWYAWALILGLGLAHHRTILLLWPALLIYLAWARMQGDEKLNLPWPGMGAAFLLPLLLYLYIPLRGMAVTSLDSTYENTWAGFWRWVTASGYGGFFTDNPLAPHYTVFDYVALFNHQFGLIGWLLAGFGLVAGWRQNGRVTVLLLLTALTNLLFAFSYRVSDVDVFFIPVFLVVAAFIGWGGQAILDWPALRRRIGTSRLGHGVLLALLIVGMVPTWWASYRADDRSDRWEVYDDGWDAMHQPLPDGAVVIGILGEVTRLRYFQQTAGVRPDLRTVAADREPDRLAAVGRQIAEGRVVYLTRPLPGVEERYSLAAEGPLIRVRSEPLAAPPDTATPIGRAVAEGISLLAYRQERLDRHDGDRLRLTLYWQPAGAVTASLKVSARLLDGAGKMVAQRDSIPVHNAYPTTAWRAGEVIPDVYDLPLPAQPRAFDRVSVILYDPIDLHEIGRIEWSPD